MEWLQISLSSAERFCDIEKTEAMVGFHNGSSPSILLEITQKMCLQQVTAQALYCHDLSAILWFFYGDTWLPQ